jgi:hypothetical protein
MRYEMQWYASCAGFADLLELEEAGPGHELPAAYGREQGDAAFDRLEAGVDAGGDHGGG